jgi:glycosyltransferase involved in cell wall biosynthesis
LKLLHLVPHIDKEAAGPSYSVPRLCQSLAACGNEVELSCLAARGEIAGVRLDIHRQWRLFGRFAISTSLTSALSDRARSIDVVHNHSLWSMVNIAAGLVVPGKGAKLVTSPRGTLSAWALNRSSGIKRVLWPLQRRVLKRADLIHATSEVEYQEIRALGFTAPVAIIPNGIDIPESRGNPLRGSDAGERTLLFLSRIHPKKGLDVLLHAWAKLQDRHPGWRLVIAGTGEGAHIQELKALATKLDVQRVEFPGAFYGDAKSRAYLRADLFVLPTHSENFGMVVAEALAHGCPAVVSLGAPWAGLQSQACGWWVANDVETLFATLDTALRTPTSKLASMGERGRKWMERDFGWTAVGQKMDATYQWLISGGEAPQWVRVD